MIRCHVFRSPFEVGITQPVVRADLEWRGQTGAALAARFLSFLPKDVRVGISVAGHKLEREEIALPLGDDVDVVIAPDPEGIGEILIAALVSSLLSITVSYVYQLLVGTPKDADVPAERGDDASQTYAWDRIATEYRPGFPVPLVFGEHDTGGQVIYASLFASTGGTTSGPYEQLTVILALSEGRIESVGLEAGGVLGEADSLGGISGQTWTPAGPLPRDLRVDGNRIDWTEVLPGARAYVRLGEVNQRALPRLDPIGQIGAFGGVAKLDTVGADLADLGSSAVHTIADASTITNAGVTVAFPAGLYEQDPQGNLLSYPSGGPGFELRISWRQVNTTVWLGAVSKFVAVPPTLAGFSVTLPFVTGAIEGPLEVKLERRTPTGGTGVVARCLWRQIEYGTQGVEFTYPRTALLGLILRATENSAGARPNFTVRVRGMRVRVWDATINAGDPSGFDHWQVPASGDPYFGIWTYPPGQNPAWILAAFLTHPAGLGEFIRDADIDWQAFRDWADYCDGSVAIDGGFEARFQFDGILDRPTSAWDWVLQICQAGRAAPIVVGNRLSIVYQYRDGHGRGTNTVPAKSRSQLFTTSNVRSFSVSYLNTEDRPAVLEGQFLNREKDFAQDSIPVDDPRGGHEDPTELNPLGYQKQTVRLFGVTRASQIRRELLFRHATAALVRSEVSFEVTREALAATVGDVIGVQHDVLRPYDREAFALRILTTATGTSTLELDRDLVLAPAVSYRVLVRDDDGDIAEHTVASVAGTYPRGTPISIAPGTIDVRAGAPVVLGEVSKLVRDFLIAGISLSEDLFRAIRAVEWNEDVFDDLNVGEEVAGGGDFAPGAAVPAETPAESDFASNALPLADDAATAGVAVGGIRVFRLPNRGGSYVIAWELPTGYSTSESRIYLRPVGASSWLLAGATRSSSFELALAPLEIYELAVAVQTKSGAFPLPEAAGVVTFTADEFPIAPPPDVSSLEFTVEDGRVVLSWDAIRSSAVEAIEIRKDSWLGGTVLLEADPESSSAAIPLLPVVSDGQEIELLARARTVDGLYSVRAATVTVVPVTPAAMVATAAKNFDPTAASSLTMSWSFGVGEFVATPVRRGGEWISDEVVVGFDAEQTVALDVRTDLAKSRSTVDGHGYEVDSGESFWRLVDGRPASLFVPGQDVLELVDDFDGPIDDVPRGRRVGVWRGSSGDDLSARLYYRTAVSAGSISTASWRPYRGPFRETFGRIQARLVLAQDGDGWSFRVAAFSMRRFLG